MLSTTLMLTASLVISQAEGEMPREVREHIDKHIIGQWLTETTWGDVVTHGENQARWAEGGRTVVSQWTGENANGGDTVYVTSVMGWDAETKAIVEYSVTSNGEHWNYHWTDISGDSWKGRGSGHFNGKEWASTAKILWKNDGSRYEDVSEGKPFVLVTRRKPSAVSQETGDATVPDELLKHFENLVGEWTSEGTTSDGRSVKTMINFRWLPGNKALMFDATWEAGELKTLGSGIFGWESARGQVHTSEFWDAGGYNHRHYTIVSDRKWEGYQFSGVNDKGQRLTQRVTIDITNPNEFSFTSSRRIVDGEREAGGGKLVFRRK